MKKKILYIFSIILCCVLVVSGSEIRSFVNEKRIDTRIKNEKPSHQEMEVFQKQIEEDTCYYYNKLNDKEKEAYMTMYISLMNFRESFYLDISKDNLKELFMAVLYDNAHIFWVKSTYTYTDYDDAVMFCPEYRHSVSEVEKLNIQLNNKIEEILSQVNLLPSEYEKELYIHNYVCENTEYVKDSESFTDTAYEALLNGIAVCEGYSRAIQILLDAADIDNYLIVGNGITDEKTEPHMWNIVKIDNINYHLDATWNDSSVTDMVSYFYFNVTDSFISKDHKDFNTSDTMCISDIANYFVMENAFVKSYNGFAEHVNRSASTLRKGNNRIEFYFTNPEDLDKAVKDIKSDNNFFNYISSAVYQSGRNLNSKEIEYYSVDKYNYLCIVLEER